MAPAQQALMVLAMATVVRMVTVMVMGAMVVLIPVMGKGSYG